MIRKVAIGLAAASLLSAATISTDALAFGRRGFGGNFHGFHGHHFGRFGGPAIGLGLGLGYGAYSSCYAWTPYGYQWVCDYPYPY